MESDEIVQYWHIIIIIMIHKHKLTSFSGLCSQKKAKIITTCAIFYISSPVDERRCFIGR